MSLAKPMSEEIRTKLGTAFEFAWGARSGPQNDGRFEMLAPGDTCVFYTRSFSGNGGNQYYLAANVVGKTRSREAGETIWQDPNFELVYFVDKPRRISISPKEISAAFSPYRPDYFANAPQSWTRVDQSVVAGLVRDFGSVGAWLERLPTILTKESSDTLGVPFNDIFSSLDEAQWAFELSADKSFKIGSQPDGTRTRRANRDYASNFQALAGSG